MSVCSISHWADMHQSRQTNTNKMYRLPSIMVNMMSEPKVNVSHIRTTNSGRNKEELCNASVTAVRDLRSETLIRDWMTDGVSSWERETSHKELSIYTAFTCQAWCQRYLKSKLKATLESTKDRLTLRWHQTWSLLLFELITIRHKCKWNKRSEIWVHPTQLYTNMFYFNRAAVLFIFI